MVGSPVSEQKVWPSAAVTDTVLGDVSALRAYVAGLAHSYAGDDNKTTQQALVQVVGQIDALAAQVQAHLGMPGVVPTVFSDAAPREWPAVEPGQVTDDVLRRIRKNAGQNAGPKHRAKP